MTKQQIFVRAAILCAFGVALVLLFKWKPAPVHVKAAPPADASVQLTGVIRDFRRAHADFDVVPSEGYGHYAGLVGAELNSDGRPVFVGELIDTRTITNFEITQGGVIPGEPYAAMVTLLGAAIENTLYHVPVTMKLHVGAETFEPFGLFGNAVTGNVNDNQTATGNANAGANPRSHIFPTVFPANTPITSTGRSWQRLTGRSGLQAAHWRALMTHNSHDQSQQVRVLRDGDPVPNVPGFNQQSSVEDYVRAFVDAPTRTIKLLENQAIYLFELGTINMLSPAADFQDLVVLVTLARDPDYLETLDVFGHEVPGGTLAGSGYKVHTQWRDRSNRPIAPHLYHDPASGTALDACNQTLTDSAGAKGAVSTGGIESAATFDQWYRDELGVNLSGAHTITLLRDSDGVYVYSTENFHPIDGMLLGNEGDDHNHYFTYAICAQFVYKKCGRQFFEFTGSDDTWLFVDGNLAMDRGGVIPGTNQYVDMDRLELVDGHTYSVCFFYGQRQAQQADFHVRTNIFFISQAPPVLSGGYD